MNVRLNCEKAGELTASVLPYSQKKAGSSVQRTMGPSSPKEA